VKVAVLGCGPAGLMAAHGARNAGAHVAIYSERRKSPLYGAQYLHAPIPGVTDLEDRVIVDYRIQGSPEKYRSKVYGPMWDGTVSPEDLSENHEAWDIRATYDRLWSLYHTRVMDMRLDPYAVMQISNDSFDLIINTIPLQALCRAGHSFQSTQVWAAGDAPELGIDVGLTYHCPPDTVICNGNETPAWYRMSRIFGHTTIEWPLHANPPVTTASKVSKPLRHNCDCWPEILKLGRYGSWEKGVLSHTAYQRAFSAVELRLSQPTLF
jgi:hypothetical protein